MKVYRVSGGLGMQGFNYYIDSGTECVEKPKSWVSKGNVISKEKILLIDSPFRQSVSDVSYYTYCLEGQQQEALDLIKANVIKTTIEMKSKLDTLHSYI